MPHFRNSDAAMQHFKQRALDPRRRAYSSRAGLFEPDRKRPYELTLLGVNDFAQALGVLPELLFAQAVAEAE